MYNLFLHHTQYTIYYTSIISTFLSAFVFLTLSVINIFVHAKRVNITPSKETMSPRYILLVISFNNTVCQMMINHKPKTKRVNFIILKWRGYTEKKTKRISMTSNKSQKYKEEYCTKTLCTMAMS